MNKIASLLTSFCIASALLCGQSLAMPAEAEGQGVAPEHPETASPIELPAGYRWVVPPKPFSLDTLEETSITVESLGEVKVKPVVQDDLVNEVLLASGAWTERSKSRQASFLVCFADQKGELIRGGPHSLTIRGDKIVQRFYLNAEQIRERAAWYGVAVLDYEGRVERAKAYENAPETQDYRVPFVPTIGEPFEFDLPTLDAGRMTHEDMLGKIVVYDAWASWCSPCLTKMPEMHKLRERFAGRGVEFVGIALESPADGAMDKARKSIEDHKLDWPHLHGFPSREANRLWFNVTGIEGIPRLFVVDREGVLRAEPGTPKFLAEAIDRLLEEQPAQAAATD